LGTALKRNPTLTLSLTHLSLSHNNIGAEGSLALAEFLATPNCLQKLQLRTTGITLETIWGALLRGCVRELTSLDLSGNRFVDREKDKDRSSRSSQAFVRFFSRFSDHVPRLLRVLTFYAS
jgi:hypothetical protein